METMPQIATVHGKVTRSVAELGKKRVYRTWEKAFMFLSYFKVAN